MSKESKRLEFKGSFDPASNEDWCKLIKDIVAMANSGGGKILIGLANDGTPSGADVSGLLAMDEADAYNRIERYVGTTPPEILIERGEVENQVIAEITVSDVTCPLIFVRPGTYAVSVSQQKTEFAKGTVYFRHGPKSEPGLPRDFEEFINKELKRRRRELFGNIKRVISAPAGARVVMSTRPNRGPVRVSNEVHAIPVRGLVDDTPYRSLQEELTGVVKAWKTDPLTFAAENQLWKFYSHRKDLRFGVHDRACLLISAVHRHAPFFFWAVGLPKERLVAVLQDVVKLRRYPGPNMAAKLAHALGGQEGESLLRSILDLPGLAARNAAAKLLRTVGDGNRIETEYGTPVISRQTAQGAEVVGLSTLSGQEREAVLDELLGREPVDKQKIKRLDIWLYAPLLTELK